MMYEATAHNLLILVRTMGQVRKEQIEKFFADADDRDILDYYLETYKAQRVFDIDEKTGIVSWHRLPAFYDKNVLARRMTAFWAVANMGYKQVRDLLLLPYPTELLVITHDNDVFDFTVCSSKMDASLANRVRSMSAVEGVEDEVTHVAIVRDTELIPQLAQFGFDVACTYDHNHDAQYEELT